MQNNYDLLKIASNATATEIKQAFRIQSLKHYNDKTKYNTILSAYNNLQSQTSHTSQTINEPTIQKYNLNQTIDISITLQQSYLGCQYPLIIERMLYDNGKVYSENEKIYISIFPGVDDGEIIISKYKGHHNISTGEKGDIKIFIKLLPHDNFTRKGLDLTYHKNITFIESICGFEFNITSLKDDIICIRNHSGDIIMDGSQKLIKGHGIIRENIVGNLLIIFHIIKPPRLNEKITKQLKDILS